MASPVPFILQDPGNPQRFVVDPAAIKILSGLKGKICPVVVTGPYRSGKSTLLNLLLNQSTANTQHRSGGFAVGSTVQACTKGIWLWGEPITIGQGANRRSLLLLDSEGLGSIGQHATFDVQIFSLSILLSSLFILNTSGPITENALEQLELVVQMTQRVKVSEAGAAKANSESDDAALANLAAHMPDFLWVLRDFALQLEDVNGNPITARQYLESSLQPVRGESARVAEKNRIRHVLNAVFSHRDCVPLVRPVTDERQLQKLSALPSNQLRPEFLAQMSALRDRIYTGARDKALEGVTVNGPAFLALAQSYVNAINTGSIPVIHSAWQSVIKLQASQAIDRATQSFQIAINKQTAAIQSSNQPITDAELNEFIERARQQSHVILHEEAVGDASQLRDLDTSLEHRLNEIQQSLRSVNSLTSREYNREIIARLWQKRGGDAVFNTVEAFTQWPKLRDQVAQEYQSQCKGSEAAAVLQHFLAERGQQLLQTVTVRYAEMEKQNAVIQAKAAELESQLKSETEKSTRLALDLEFAHKQYTALEDQLTQAKAEVERSGRASADREAHQKQEFSALKKELKQSQDEVANLTRTSTNAEVRLAKLQSQHETETKRFEFTSQQQAEEKHRAVQTATKSAEEAKSKVTKLEAELSKLRQQVEVKSSELQTSVKRQEAAAHDWSAQLEAKNHELQRLKQEFESSRTALESQLKDTQSLAARSSKKDEEFQSLKRSVAKSEQEKLFFAKQNQEMDEEIKQQATRLGHLEQELQQRDTEIERLRKANVAKPREFHEAKRPKLDNQRAPPPVDADAIMDVEEIDDNDDAEDHAPARAPRPSASIDDFKNPYLDAPPRAAKSHAQSISLAAGRPSLAPRKIRESEGDTPVDPNKLTINELKSWLTELEIELPMKQLTKSWYVERVFEALPELEAHFPRKASAATAGKKGKR